MCHKLRKYILHYDLQRKMYCNSDFKKFSDNFSHHYFKESSRKISIPKIRLSINNPNFLVQVRENGRLMRIFLPIYLKMHFNPSQNVYWFGDGHQ